MNWHHSKHDDPLHLTQDHKDCIYERKNISFIKIFKTIIWKNFCNPTQLQQSPSPSTLPTKFSLAEAHHKGIWPFIHTEIISMTK